MESLPVPSMLEASQVYWPEGGGAGDYDDDHNYLLIIIFNPHQDYWLHHHPTKVFLFHLGNAQTASWSFWHKFYIVRPVWWGLRMNWKLTNNLQQLIIDQMEPSKQIISKLFWFETQTFQWCALHATRTPSPWAAPLPCKQFLNTWPWQKKLPWQRKFLLTTICYNHMVQLCPDIKIINLRRHFQQTLQ